MVQDVEELRTDLDCPGLLELDPAAQTEIDIELIRPHDAVAPRVTEGARLVLNECRGIEVLRERGLFQVRITHDIGTIQPDAGQRIVTAGGETQKIARSPAGNHKRFPAP